MGDVWALVLVGAGAIAAGFGVAIAKGRRMKQFNIAARAVDAISPMFPHIPRSLVLAIIGRESQFNPEARNLKSAGDVARGGAWGLMQVTLATALKVKPLLGISWDGTGEGLLNPLTNVAIGMEYLSTLLSRFHNDADMAVAAYNRGAHGVDVALSQGVNLREDPYVRAVRDMRDSFESEGYG
jgi:soluble lytic murein transglycosylase-like protein